MMDGPCWSDDERAWVLADLADGLWQYMGRLAAPTAPPARVLADLTGLTPEALHRLRHLHLLLDECVTQFVDEALPPLLRHLRPIAPPQLQESRHAVRGRIAWGATTAARARAAGDRTLYVAAVAHPQSRAEARLLRATLEELQRSCRALRVVAPLTLAVGWTARLERTEAAVVAALRAPALATGVGEATAADLATCQSAQQPMVRALVQASIRVRDLAARPLPEALLAALAHRALAPLDDDALYELWVLLGAALVAQESGWQRVHAELIGLSAVPLTYRSPHHRWTLRLRFGHTPGHWKGLSRYRTLFTRYGVPGAVRRPDLIVELQSGRLRRYLLVEVKRTRDPGYIADSIYKVLGYLADFAPIYAHQEGPHALLVVWDGIAEAAPQPIDGVTLATHRAYRGTLSALLERLGSD